MNKRYLVQAICGVFAFAVMKLTATPNGFTDDYDEAARLSATTGKPMFVVFTGSDWCKWCIALEKGYLTKEQFVAEATKGVIPVYVDSPKDRSKLSETARRRNPQLERQFKINGYPTTLFVMPSGESRPAPRPANEMNPAAYGRQIASLAPKMNAQDRKIKEPPQPKLPPTATNTKTPGTANVSKHRPAKAGKKRTP